MNFRIVHPLSDLHICRTGNPCHNIPNLVGRSREISHPETAHFDIDWCRKTGIDHIADDSAGLEGELQSRELPTERLAQLHDNVIGAHLMVTLQAYEHIGLMRTIHRRVEHHPALRQADVRDDLIQIRGRYGIPDQSFDFGDNRLCFLDSGSFRRREVQDE